MKILKVKCLAPTRLDNYLMQQFPALNPGRLNKALRENKIKLNGKKQPLSTRVMAGCWTRTWNRSTYRNTGRCRSPERGFHNPPA